MEKTTHEKNIKRMLQITHNKKDFDGIELSKYNYIVKATDKFMSGWGRAENKIAKSLLLCETKKQAFIAIEKMDKYFKFKNWYNINCETIPLNESNVIYTLRTIDHCPLWK